MRMALRAIQQCICSCCRLAIHSDANAYPHRPGMRIWMRCCPSCATPQESDDDVLIATKRFIAQHKES